MAVGCLAESLLFNQPGRNVLQANCKNAAGVFSFSLQTVASAALFQPRQGSDQQAGLLWQVENGSTGTLTLVDFSLADGALHTPLALEFPMQLFPGVVVISSASNNAVVIGITATGHLFSTPLQASDATQPASVQGFTADRVQLVDLAPHWQTLGTPTALAVSSQHILIGGSLGTVLAVPFSWLAQQLPSLVQTLLGSTAGAHQEHHGAGTQRPFELQESSWGLKSLITGVWQKPRRPAVVTICHLPGGVTGTQAALVLYDDCSLRGFNLSRQAQIVSDVLEPDAHVHRLMPVYASLCAWLDGAAGSRVALIVQYEAQDSLSKSVVAYVLDQGAPGGRLHVSARTEISCPSSATLVAAHVVGGMVWVVLKSPGDLTQLVGHSLSGSSSGGAATSTGALLEAHMLPVPATAAAAGTDATLQLALWEAALQSVASDSPAAAAGSSSPAVTGPHYSLAAQQVLRRILSPTTLCRSSLRESLAYVGSHMTLAEAETASLAQLSAAVEAAVQAVVRRNPGQSTASCWAAFLGTYQEAWSRKHPLLGLVQAAGGGAAGSRPELLVTVRGGGMLGVLRPQDPVESLAGAWRGTPAHQQQHSSSTSRSTSGWPADVPNAAFAQLSAVRQAAHSIAAALGPLAHDALISATLSGSDALQQLAPRFTELLLHGPQAASTGGAASPPALDDATRAAHAAWRQGRQRLLLDLGQALAAVYNPVQSIQQYAALLLQLMSQRSSASRGAQPPPSALAPPSALSTFLTSAASQVAYAQLYEASAMLLLLGLLDTLGGVRPQLPLSSAQLAQLTPSVPLQLAEALQRAALVYWVCNNSSSASTVTGGADGARGGPDAQALAQLHLGSVRGAAPRTALPPSLAGGSSISLTAKLLPSLAHALPQPSAILASSNAAAAVVSALQYGPGEGGARPSLCDRALELGLLLFSHQEYPALAGLTRLMSHTLTAQADGSSTTPGLAPSAAGPQLLLGISLACRLRGLQGHERAAAVSTATSCIFRAAAGLDAATKDSALHAVVHGLAHHLSGMAGSSPEEEEEEEEGHHESQRSGVALQLYEAAMMLFDREGAPEGAVACARAALQHLQPDAKGASATQPKMLERAGRLWTNVFAYCCQLGQWQDAYAALVSNPLPQRALDCLRHLVTGLSTQGDLTTLVSLPLAGVLLLPASTSGGPPTAVSLLEEALGALERRAVNADVSTAPQPYRVLHDFCVSRCDFLGAARAMFGYARRLRLEDPRCHAAMAQAILTAYDACVNALSLVDEPDAWLDMSQPWLKRHALPGEQQQQQQGGDEAAPCLTLAGLRAEQALVRAAVLAATSGGPPDLHLGQPLSGDSLLAQLLLGGRYEDALDLAHAVWAPGSTPLLSALARTASALAGAAARLQLQQGSAGESHLAALLEGDTSGEAGALPLSACHDPLGTGAGGALGSWAAPLWAKLRQILARYQGDCVPGDVVRAAAVDGALRVDRRIALPLWLLALFTASASASTSPQASSQGPTALARPITRGAGMSGAGCGPAALLELYLVHDRSREAVAVVVEALGAFSRSDARARKKHAATWFPHGHIGLLRQRLLLDVERGAPGAASLLARLDKAWESHEGLAAHDTSACGGRATGFPAIVGWS